MEKGKIRKDKNAKDKETKNGNGARESEMQ